MKLDEFKQAQIEEIMEWADDLGGILTPDSVRPVHLKEFPLAMETSERLKRICKFKLQETRDEAQLIADRHMSLIEASEYIFKFNGAGLPVMKKKFPSAEKRERELRRRLSEDTQYQTITTEQHQWDMMFSDWYSHFNKLRREMHILELEYSASGSDVWQIT